jgi:hypothetical protein
MPTIRTCGGPQRATEFSYEGTVQAGIVIMFDTVNVTLRTEFLQAIITEFRGRTIRGGFKMDDPPPDGFGRWVQDNSNLLNGQSLTPRHASFIAAILRHEGYLNCRLDGNAVILDFNP